MTRTLLLSASMAGLLTAMASAALAKSPQDFITDAIQGDNSEIMLGQLAQQKAGSDQARNFGQTLVTDHSAAKQDVAAVAKSLNATPSDEPAKKALDEQAKLSKLTGAAFDTEFANYMVKDHQEDIKAFQAEADAKSGPASDLAAKQLPTLQKHLQMAQAIAASDSTQTGNAAATGAGKTDFLTQEGADLWRGSKLPGVNVYGPDNKKVGGITDVLMDRDGKAQYIVIGVGGFLGIGQKDVAVPYAQVKFTNEPLPQPAAPAATTGTAPAAGTLPAAGTASTVVPAAGTGETAAPAAASAAHSTAYPDHGMIDLTADQLKSAPTFQFAK